MLSARPTPRAPRPARRRAGAGRRWRCSSPAAASARAQETIFDAPRELIGGATPESRAAALNELRALGADTIRINLPWRYLVPRPGRSKKPAGFNAADPGDYPQTRWGTVDGVVRGALARGMQVLMTPSGPIPDWASASGRSRIAKPLPKEYGAFVTAVGRRYSGSFRPVPCAGAADCRSAARPATRPSPASRTGLSTTRPTRASSCCPSAAVAGPCRRASTGGCSSPPRAGCAGRATARTGC